MRADLYLAQNGYAVSRERARQMIEAGCVFCNGKKIAKPSAPIAEGAEISLLEYMPYVGRGGVKLEAALSAFLPDVSGLRALDIGASTGGFTDCLLQHGAASVCAVDSGIGQLAKKLLDDPRVTSMEHCNARYLTPEMIGGCVDLIVMDVSFVSATYFLPLFPQLLLPHGKAICLIKPQFEVGKSMIGKGGIVKDEKAHRMAIDRVINAGIAAGLTPLNLIGSPILGGDGNREFLICFSAESRETLITKKKIDTVIHKAGKEG